jgi:hypothetical protein
LIKDTSAGGRAQVELYACAEAGGGFARSRELFDSMVEGLAGSQAMGLEHADLEEQLRAQGRELMQCLFQDHLDLRAVREQRAEQVTGADEVARRSVERGHTRGLLSVFGEVSVERMAYRAVGVANLYPADAGLNLPVETHSHGVRRLAAIEATRGSYEDAHDALVRSCGISVGKRQLEALVGRAAVDVDAFYAQRRPGPRPDTDLLALSADAKGVVMRPEALREGTKRNAALKAAAGGSKLTTRLTGGEKLGRKRMAAVGAVYDAAPAQRQPSDIITVPGAAAGTVDPPPPRNKGPVAAGKWLTASIADTATEVITQVFAEAARRDPTGKRTWVVLVDGARYQLDAIRAEATRRNQPVHIVIDFIHVLEYLWKAAWCLHPTADPAAETWVANHALQILHGNATQVATAIADQATQANLSATRRKNLNRCTDYLTNNADHLHYDHALDAGWPIATGIIEGACRHLIKDRMDITGARWGLSGAEAILKLRALISNGDFDDYWPYHLEREHQRTHQTRYQQPTAA